jgi:ribA/ribD-fused uncharacterized protein
MATIETFAGKHAFLSNFHPSPMLVTLLGSRWTAATVEHAFQASKILCSLETDDAKRRYALVRVISAETPGRAKRYGRTMHIDSRRWEALAPLVMRSALRLKFEDPILRGLLLGTGEDTLIEGNTWGDTKWGMVNGVGRNLLGEMLMDLRAEIREEESTITLDDLL